MCCPQRSFRGHHSEKMKGSARGNCDFREGQQTFRPNPNEVGDSTTTLRRLLIGADKAMSYINIYTNYTSLHKAMSYINTCAAVIPVKSTGHPKHYRTESTNLVKLIRPGIKKERQISIQKCNVFLFPKCDSAT